MSDPSGAPWLLLIHQLPPKPAYLRVKVGRKLVRVGAVALKNSVYVLPCTESAIEDFQWVRREIVEGGGDATVVEARLVDGLVDAEVETLFHAARDADYAQIAEEARGLSEAALGSGEEVLSRLEADLVRLERRLEAIEAIDFLGAPGHEAAAGLVSGLRRRLEAMREPTREPVATLGPSSFVDLVWVTRARIGIDRIATAWLVRRFVDRGARFEFVAGRSAARADGRIRFDMAEAELTHEGDLCTFEVLLGRLGLASPALRAVADVVHDVDLKDARHGRPETAGIAAQIAGIAALHRDDDEARLDAGLRLFDQLHAHFDRTTETRT